MKTFITLSLLCVCLFSKLESKAQFETYVQANVVSYYPPVGPYNYFGYDLTNLTDQTITVEGYLREEGGTSTPNYYFAVTLGPYENVTSDWVYVLVQHRVLRYLLPMYIDSPLEKGLVIKNTLRNTVVV